MKKTLAIILACTIASTAMANITSWTGSIVDPTTLPISLAQGSVESNTDIFVYQERLGFALGGDLFVDIANDGVYTNSSQLNGAGDTIPAETVVNSYLVHVDPVGTPSALLPVYSGEITFSNPILGIITQTATLITADAIVGLSTTTYDSGGNRGLEWQNNNDAVNWSQISLSSDHLILKFYAANAIDEIRVIEAVPAPGALLLGSMGVGFVGWLRRRRAL